MTSAPVGEQTRLLELADLDTQLRQLQHRRRTLPELAELETLSARSGAVDASQVHAATTVNDLQRAVRKAEADVEQVRTRAARDQQRLDSGTGSAKDLTGLQHELQTLAKRQADLEEVELEVMEQLEAAEASLAEIDAERSTLTEQTAQVTATRDASVAEIDGQESQLAEQRAALAASVEAGLLAIYERVRESSGVAAARVTGNRCGGCRVEFSAAELGAIKAASPQTVVQCEECRCILVRDEP